MLFLPEISVSLTYSAQKRTIATNQQINKSTNQQLNTTRIRTMESKLMTHERLRKGIRMAIANSASIPQRWVDVKTAYDICTRQFFVRCCVMGLVATFKVDDMDGPYVTKPLDDKVHSLVLTLWGEPPADINALVQ